MIPLYLNQSAHIVDQICESDVTIPTPLKNRTFSMKTGSIGLRPALFFLLSFAKNFSSSSLNYSKSTISFNSTRGFPILDNDSIVFSCSNKLIPVFF